MSTNNPIRRLALPALVITGLVLGAVVLIGPQTEAQAQQQAVDPAMKVGVYDQQALFDEYPGSEELMQYYQQIQPQMQEAQQAGDQQKMQQLQQATEQKRKEVIANFQNAVKQALPEVASNVGIKVVAIQVVYAADDVQTTNLTKPLAAAIAEE